MKKAPIDRKIDYNQCVGFNTKQSTHALSLSDRINKWALLAVTTGVGEVAHCDLASELNAHLEGNLATEASMVVLDTLELIVQGKQIVHVAFK